MKWLILVVGLLAPALAGCQVTIEAVKAPAYEPNGSGTTGAGSTAGGTAGSHAGAFTNSAVT